MRARYPLGQPSVARYMRQTTRLCIPALKEQGFTLAFDNLYPISRMLALLMKY